MSYDPDQRITRKDAAVLARCSEKALLRDEQKRGLARETGPVTKQATYRLGDLVEIQRIRLQDVALTGNAAEAAPTCSVPGSGARAAPSACIWSLRKPPLSSMGARLRWPPRSRVAA